MSMSLRGQFFLSVILALVLGLALLAVVACWQARASVENEMAKALEAGDRVVDNALVSLPQGGQDAYLTRLVQSFDDNRHVRVRLLDHGRVLAASRPATPDPVPGWYQRLLEIPVERRLDDPPQLAGRALLVETDAHNEIGEAWVQFRDGAAILALFSMVVLGLLHLALARAARPLARLNAGFDALGGGDYDIRVPAQGPRELDLLAEGFNRMSARLGALESANRRLSGQMLAIQEEERADIARDLHDEMGPWLFAMRLDAEALAADAVRMGDGAMQDRAAKLGEAVGHLQQRVRSILQQLRPEGLAELGLATAIANLAAFWQRHHAGIVIHLDIAAADAGFGAETNAVLYRLVQEGLTNAARHAAARNVWLTIARGDVVTVTLEDDGRGRGGGQDGMGLKGMRERLAALAGTLDIGTRPGGGTRLTAMLSLAQAVMA